VASFHSKLSFHPNSNFHKNRVFTQFIFTQNKLPNISIGKIVKNKVKFQKEMSKKPKENGKN